MKKPLRFLVKTLIWLAVTFVAFWFTLPPINLRSKEFWTFFCFSVIAAVIISAFSDIFIFIKDKFFKKTYVQKNWKESFKSFSAPIKVGVLTVGVVIVLSVIASVIGSQFFNASRYNKLLSISDGDFAADVAEITMEQIPVVDRDTAMRLGQRKLGEMADLVSQFEILPDYTQINYKGKPVRVTPLAYGDVIKWLNNQKDGIPAYITVDMTTQETSLVRLNQGIKYSESEYFMRNIYRYLRFKYPTKIFDSVSFEIDDNGTPYFVASTVSYKIGLYSGKDIGGAVLVNAVNGEHNYYNLNEIPSWVDQVFDSSLIIEQLVYNGKYRSGYFNSIFGQKGVLQPTDGYNYLAINDDVYLYTGITSVTSDESNVGFVLCNLRTKETKYYAIPGAEEYSAMGSAEGQVQHLGYRSTFPLLLNINNRPSYFMSLKDGAGLVKMYAFVDVQQYQIVGTGNSVMAAKNDYINRLKQDNSVTDTQTAEITGTVAKIATAVKGGETCYYIQIDNSEEIYIVPVSLSEKLVFLSVGNTITLNISSTGSVISVEF